MEGLEGYVLMAVAGLAAFLYLRHKGVGQNYRAVLLAIAALGVACFVTGLVENGFKGEPEAVRELERKEAGSGSSQEELVLDAGELLEGYSYPVTVTEHQLTEAEAERYFAAAAEELETLVMGENPSLDQISTDLVLPETLQGGAVEASCYLDSYDVVDVGGKVSWDDVSQENELVKVTAMMTCQEWEAEHSFYIRLLPAELDEQGALLREIRNKIDAENAKKGVTSVKLPEEAGGISLKWQRGEEPLHRTVFLLGIICMACCYIYTKEKQDHAKKERERMLTRDYPDIVSQFSLLTGAGMTVPAAWARIASEYDARLARGACEERPGYEELKRTWHEMQDGIGEMQAYGSFGERCGLPQYRKFSSILMQNVRKGTKGMQQLLDAEAEEAFLKRKAYARKMGEEAGTKLLLPMGIMLIVIFAILLMPSMMGMRI